MLLFGNALNIMFSMLFNLLIASKTILLSFFFFFPIFFLIFLAIPLLIENTDLRLLVVLPASVLITSSK